MKINQDVGRKFLYGLTLITSLLIGIPPSVFAASNSVYLAPASGTSQPGNVFTVSVDGYGTGSWWQNTSSASGTVNFQSSLLKVVSINRDGTSFPSGTVTLNNTNGTITFNTSCGFWCGYSNQTVHLFAITFESLSTGTANVTFSNAKYNTGAATMSGGTYIIASPSPTPSPTPIPTPSVTPTPSPSVSPTPGPTTPPSPRPSTTPAPTPLPTIVPTSEKIPETITSSDGGLKIQNVKITATRQENIIKWNTNSLSVTQTLKYGVTRNNQASEGEISKKEEGGYSTTFVDLKPGTMYFFTIKVTSLDGLQGSSYSGTLLTRGYPVELTVKQNNLRVPGAKATIDGRSFVANENAVITTELSDGNHKAIITPLGSDKSYEASFAVAKVPVEKSEEPEPQIIDIGVTTIGTSTNSNTPLAFIIGSATAFVGMTTVIGFLLYRRNRKIAPNTAGIDPDLLSSTYGSTIENHRSTTPEPNLESPNANQVSNEPLAESAVNTGDDNLTPSTPAPESISSTETQALDIVKQTNEELSAEVAQIESGNYNIAPISNIDSNETNAVYNEATGELEIIHERNTSRNDPRKMPPSSKMAVIS